METKEDLSLIPQVMQKFDIPYTHLSDNVYSVDIDELPNERQHCAESAIKKNSIALHYTVSSLERVLGLFTRGGTNRASSHIIISEQGEIIRLIPENKTSWHIGFGTWKGIGRQLDAGNLNDYALGVEFVNQTHTLQSTQQIEYLPYPKEQIQVAVPILKSWCVTYEIQPSNIFGHACADPLRKSDPGPLFPWEELYKNGIGAWIEHGERSVATICNQYVPSEKKPGNTSEFFFAQLHQYGYHIPDASGALSPENLRLYKVFDHRFVNNQSHRTEPYIDTESLHSISDDAQLIAWGLCAKYASSAKN